MQRVKAKAIANKAQLLHFKMTCQKSAIIIIAATCVFREKRFYGIVRHAYACCHKLLILQVRTTYLRWINSQSE